MTIYCVISVVFKHYSQEIIRSYPTLLTSHSIFPYIVWSS